jgi:hypothetical protein
LVGARPPAWIEQVDGKLRLVPKRAAVVQRIFKLAAEGMGHTRIVTLLQEEQVPAFGERVVREGRSRSQFAGRWSKAYVALMLRDRRTVGEYQPYKGNDPAGSPLANYFPAAITEDEFNLARAAQEQRCNRDAIGRRLAARQGKYVNVFRGMLTHARDGEGILLHNKGTGAKPDLILINTRGNEGRSKSYTFPYPIFEERVLKMIREVDPTSVLPRTSPVVSRVDALRAELKNTREDIAHLQADLKAGYSKALAEVLRSREADEERVANELQDELVRTTLPLARAWDELPTLIDLIRGADDPDRARLKVRTVLRAVIESAILLIVPRKSWRFAFLQLAYVGGAVRHYLIAHQAAAYRRAGATYHKSEVFNPAPYDIHKPADLKMVEKLLARLDVSKLGCGPPVQQPLGRAGRGEVAWPLQRTSATERPVGKVEG